MIRRRTLREQLEADDGDTTPDADDVRMRVLEAIDGPYAGYLFRVPRGERLVAVRPKYDADDRPLERYRVEVVGIDTGEAVLRHAPDPDAPTLTD